MDETEQHRNAHKGEFTEAEEALIEKIAFRVYDKVEQRIIERRAEAIAEHSRDCPAPKWLNRIWWILVGFLALAAYLGYEWATRVVAVGQQMKP